MSEVTIKVPIATRDTLGGAMIGAGLNITPEGLLSSEVTQQLLDDTTGNLNVKINNEFTNLDNFINNDVEETLSAVRTGLALINNNSKPLPNSTIESEFMFMQESIYDIQSAINQKGVQVTNDVSLNLYGNKIRQITDIRGLQIVYWYSEPSMITAENPIMLSQAVLNFVFNTRRITLVPGGKITLWNMSMTEEISNDYVANAQANGNTL